MKFKPIINEELDSFRERVDLIVNFMNQKRKEQRDKETENPDFDPKQLRS